MENEALQAALTVPVISTAFMIHEERSSSMKNACLLAEEIRARKKPLAMYGAGCSYVGKVGGLVKYYHDWNAIAACESSPMSSDRIIVEAIKVAQDFLCQNLPPAQNLTDAATVMRFRELMRSQATRSALERSSDTLFSFALRGVERVISDHSRTNRETINQLWEVLDDLYLNQALRKPLNRRRMVGPPKRY